MQERISDGGDTRFSVTGLCARGLLVRRELSPEGESQGDEGCGGGGEVHERINPIGS